MKAYLKGRELKQSESGLESQLQWIQLFLNCFTQVQNTD